MTAKEKASTPDQENTSFSELQANYNTAIPRTRKAAIDKHCRDCIYDRYAPGTWRQQVAACTSPKCALFSFRPLPIGYGSKKIQSLELAPELREKEDIFECGEVSPVG